jgi:RNA polymerase sigma factor (sigma-70 family)
MMTATAGGAGTPSDRDVIASSLDRPEAFEAVFERHSAAIYRYLRRRVGTALAEELTAEAFARAFRARRRFDHRSESALPWLYGTAANLLRMHRRGEERRLRAYARAAEGHAEASTGAESDHRLDAAALKPALASALADLSMADPLDELRDSLTGELLVEGDREPSPAPTKMCPVSGGQWTKSHARSRRSSPSISSRHSPVRTRKSSRLTVIEGARLSRLQHAERESNLPEKRRAFAFEGAG